MNSILILDEKLIDTNDRTKLIEEIAKEYEGKVKVGKVNIDEFAQLAIKYGVASIPTVILFKDGQAVDKSVGFVPKANLEAMLK